MPSSKQTAFTRQDHPCSSLARLQQALLMGVLVLACAWAWWASARSMVWAGAGVLFLTLGYALVLAFECVVAGLVNRTDTVPRASGLQWLKAWWQEVKAAPQVFVWRQPFAWRRLPDSSEMKTGSQPAVVFIHGFVCNRGFWLPWMARLKALSVPYVSINLEPIFGSIDDYVPLIDAAVRRATDLTGNPPILICHSMGGLAARAWLAFKPGAVARIDKVITIGTPHRGTWLARWSHLENGRQMRHNGPWQQQLGARELGLYPELGLSSRFVCWYTNTDNIVFPASTATLEGADNRLVTATAHVALAFHPTVMQTSLAMVLSASSVPSERAAS